MRFLLVMTTILVGSCTSPQWESEVAVQHEPELPPEKAVTVAPMTGKFADMRDWHGVTFRMTCAEAETKLTEAGQTVERHLVRRFPLVNKGESKGRADPGTPRLVVTTPQGRWSVTCDRGRRVRRIGFASGTLEELEAATKLVDEALVRYGDPKTDESTPQGRRLSWRNEVLELTVSLRTTDGGWWVESVFQGTIKKAGSSN